jgi:hypothetical protein
MDVFGRSSGGERPLERFKPTTGVFAGWSGLLVAGFAIVYVALGVHTVVGLRIALAAVFAAVVVWVTQLRPRVTAYPDRLRMLGALRDAELPYVLVDEVDLGQTLNVWVGDRRFRCIGIGRSLGKDIRASAKKQRQGSLLGAGRMREFSEKAELAAPDQTAMSYQTFVVTRIEELVEQARRDLARAGGSTEGVHVTRPWAVPEVVALVVSGLAFAASLLL